MSIDKNQTNGWIKIKTKKNHKNSPSELQIDMDGTVYIDGELYNEATCKYKNLSVDVENHNRLSTGEETEKIIEASKKRKRGESIVIKDVEGPDRRESTTVKF
ncbi:hypothetical protein [Natronincola ferrireducens]|uniref:Uncharacterized protein n=1 Tax=Natronincola ferrireducens TaxID=393762 RepID=A0A1G8YYP4_9FIRM|nr:hypothetical protein [Natronincola ferrireducens]SDK07100.1 hypothetical protein SAMN05660472_00666 [Natronincola ferrireducens]